MVNQNFAKMAGFCSVGHILLKGSATCCCMILVDSTLCTYHPELLAHLCVGLWETLRLYHSVQIIEDLFA